MLPTLSSSFYRLSAQYSCRYLKCIIFDCAGVPVFMRVYVHAPAPEFVCLCGSCCVAAEGSPPL